MRILIFFLLTSFVYLPGTGNASAFVRNDRALVIPREYPPLFQGKDLQYFRRWVAERVRYPEQLADSVVTGRVITEFVVETDGSLSGVKVILSPSEALSREVLRVICSSPQWEPVTESENISRTKFMVPIEFGIDQQSGRIVVK